MKIPLTVKFNLLLEHLSLIDSRLLDVFEAWRESESRHDIQALSRHCYLQGLLDASDPRVVSHLKALKGESLNEGV